MWFCRLLSISIKTHSISEKYIFIWWKDSNKHIIHNVWNFWCNFDEWQFFFWWVCMYKTALTKAAGMRAVCLWHMTRIYAEVLTHLQPQKPHGTDFSSNDWWKRNDAFLKLRGGGGFFVIYWLSNYRAARAIIKTYIYLLNFINENYKH